MNANELRLEGLALSKTCNAVTCECSKTPVDPPIIQETGHNATNYSLKQVM